jgi:hypothetical protein
MLRALIAASLLASAAFVPRASAQHRTLEPGDDVRVVAPTLYRGAVRGLVVRYMADTLAVREAGTDSVYAFPMTHVRDIARNEGVQRGRSMRHSLQLGAFLGAAIGLVTGPFLAKTGEDGAFVRNTALSGASGTVAGAGLGALLGSVFAGDHWQRFRVPRRSCADPSCAPVPAPAPALPAQP